MDKDIAEVLNIFFASTLRADGRGARAGGEALQVRDQSETLDLLRTRSKGKSEI